MTHKASIILTFILVLASNMLFAQAGNLDLTFSTDGKVTTDFSTESDMVQSVVVQPNGKIIAAGFSWSGSNCYFALARYNDDGSLDNSFGTAGKLTTDLLPASDQANAVILQPDGKIIAAGFSNNGTNNDFALVRYNTNGTLDTTFNHTGIVITAMGSGIDVIYAVAIDSNDKIVVAGESKGSSNTDFAIARYTMAGIIDSSFSSDGKVVMPVFTASDRAYSVAVQSDNKIVVAGSTVNGSSTDFALVRLNETGVLDSTFDSDGILVTNVAGDDVAYSVALQTDGKIVVGGQAKPGNNYDFALVRYNIDGSLDNSFSSDGKVTTAIGTMDDYIYAIAIQDDGKIVAAGYSYTSSTNTFALARYNTNGSLDNTFSGDGKLTTSIGTVCGAKAVALQPDGKIVAAGYSGSNNMFALARYIADAGSGITNLNDAVNSVIIYPNPIGQSSILKYMLNDEDIISLVLFDMQGRKIVSLLDCQKQTAGEHEVMLSFPSDLAAGVYELVLSGSQGRHSIRIVK